MKGWLEQVVWFAAGILATGALWFFLSIENLWGTLLAAAGTVALVGAAIWLGKRAENPLHDPIVLHAGEERITFDELVRTNNHMAGIASEYEWVKRRYPGSEVIMQFVWKLPGPGFNPHDSNSRPLATFDTLHLRLADGRKKNVQFDITSFFENSSISGDKPNKRVFDVIASLYSPEST